MSEQTSPLKQLHNKIIQFQLVSAVASMVIVLGLYGLFVADEKTMFTILNQKEFCYGLLFIGGIVEIFVIAKIIPLMKALAKERAKSA